MNKTSQQNKKGGVSLVASVALLLAGTVALAVAVLLPFAMRAHTPYFSVASTPGVGPVTYYTQPAGPAGTTIVQTGQSASIGWQMPPSVDAAGIAGIVVMTLVGIAVFWLARSKSMREMRRVSQVQLILATAAVVIIGGAYALIRPSSQAAPEPIRPGQSVLTNSVRGADCEAVVFPTPQSFDIVNEPCSHAIKNPKRPFGYGLAPAYVICDSALFLAAPLLMWSRYGLDRRYVGGQKKDALFQ